MVASRRTVLRSAVGVAAVMGSELISGGPAGATTAGAITKDNSFLDKRHRNGRAVVMGVISERLADQQGG